MSLLRLDLDLTDAQNTIDSQLLQNRGGNRRYLMDQIAEYLDRLANGTSNMNSGRLVTGAVKASTTLTFTGAPVAAETFTINGVTFTARASGAVANEFNIGGTITITAANVAAMINASVTAKIANCVVATSALGVVTITCVVPGLIGNCVTLTESLTNATLAATNLTGGAEASITAITA